MHNSMTKERRGESASALWPKRRRKRKEEDGGVTGAHTGGNQIITYQIEGGQKEGGMKSLNFTPEGRENER